jgi:hypothetical protein
MHVISLEGNQRTVCMGSELENVWRSHYLPQV